MSDTQTTDLDADLNLAKRIAKILGDHSAAAMALAEYERRKNVGETSIIFRDGNSWVVTSDPRWYAERQ